MQYLNRPFELKSVGDAGTFSGYASVFGEVDSYNDIVLKGAFTKSLKEFVALVRKVPILWQHNTDAPIGIYASIEEDDIGLKVEGQLNLDVQQGREAHSLLKQGALSGISIGYETVKSKTNNSSGIRELSEIKLYEASLATFPACDGARVMEVRSLLTDGELPSLPDFEKFLRDAGFSRSQAKTVTSHGLAKLTQRDVATTKAVSQVLAILNS